MQTLPSTVIHRPFLFPFPVRSSGRPRRMPRPDPRKPVQRIADWRLCIICANNVQNLCAPVKMLWMEMHLLTKVCYFKILFGSSLRKPLRSLPRSRTIWKRISRNAFSVEKIRTFDRTRYVVIAPLFIYNHYLRYSEGERRWQRQRTNFNRALRRCDADFMERSLRRSRIQDQARSSTDPPPLEDGDAEDDYEEVWETETEDEQGAEE